MSARRWRAVTGIECHHKNLIQGLSRWHSATRLTSRSRVPAGEHLKPHEWAAVRTKLAGQLSDEEQLILDKLAGGTTAADVARELGQAPQHDLAQDPQVAEARIFVAS